MKALILAASLIAGWQPVDGITEQEAFERSADAIGRGAATYDCDTEEIYGYEYDTVNLIGDTPAFAINAYARTCDDRYDCRVIFKKEEGAWKEGEAYCEPLGVL